MKKNILPFYLIFLFLGLTAQKEDGNILATYYKITTCKSYFPKVVLKGERNLSNIQKYLTDNIANLNDTKVGLKMNYVNESPGGFHYSFTQTFNGIKIYQSEVKINFDRHNTIRSVFDNSENTSGWHLNTESATANSVIATNPSTQLPVVAQRNVDQNSNEILTANGEIIFQHSLRSYFTNQDSLVYGNIFNPDPLTTAQTYYGAPYINDSGRTNSSLNAQMQNVAFRTNFNGSQFTLESAFVRESDFDPPNIAPATSSTPQFNFNRSESGFQDVNAFYHISTMYKYIHSLGFNCADSLVEIDTHALSGADQSYFTSGFIPHRIYYGIGGVPDCEDADVCVHEWGHSISYTAAPESNYGLQRNSLDEGFGDYLAGSYSRSISTFNEYWVFNWDGHNEFWSGRILNTCRTYPDSLSTSIYKNGEMWSSTIFAINHDIGRNAADSLILETHYNYAANISMADAAQILIDADSVLTNGKYHNYVYGRLHQWGFVGNGAVNACITTNIQKMPSDLNVDFTQDGVSFRIFNPDQQIIHLNILNINGQLVSQRDIKQLQYSYQNENLAAGIYLVSLQTESAMKTFKWCIAK